MDLLCCQIGGLYCGLWKRNVLESSGVIFPTKLRYEDNYYASLVKCYLRKIALIPKVCYFYRTNPTSTVHARNETYQMDRIQIERILLADVKKRKLFERYYAAWEYQYTFRYAYNTCWLLLSTYDTPPVEIFRQVWRDLEKEFPHWRENRYYQILVDAKGKWCYFLFRHFPHLAIWLFPRLRKVKDFVKRLLCR